MKTAILLLFPLIIGISSGKQIPLTSDQEIPEVFSPIHIEDIDGPKIYRKKCQWCHGKDGNKTKKDVASLMKSQLSDDEKKDIVKNGKGVMPPFGPSLNEAEVDAVVIFINGFANP